MGTRRAVRIAAIACAVIVVLILVITLTPEPVDKPYGALVSRIVRAVRAVPGFRWFDYNALERVSNVLMFVPLGVLLELVVGWRRWWWVLIIAAGFSGCLELAQSLWLPHRTASVTDIIDNTVGGGIGATLSALVTVVVRRMRAASSARRRARE